MPSDIETLNHRFGEAFGFPDGVRPRFAWMWKPGILVNSKSWAICQLAPNPFTPDQWTRTVGERLPYPGKLRWIEHGETALPAGVEPTVDHTSFYIRTLRAQMAAGEQAERDAAAGRKDAATIAAETEAQAAVDAASTEFQEAVADWEPLSWKAGEPHEPGDQDGPVSFGGIDATA